MDNLDMNGEQNKRHSTVINMKPSDFERLREELKRLSPLQLQYLQGDIQLALLRKDNEILSLEERDALAKLFT